MVYTHHDGGIRYVESIAFSGGLIVGSQSFSTPVYHTRYYLRDHLGSVRSIVDGTTGQVLERNDYTAYGLRWDVAGYPRTNNRYLFNGKEEVKGGYLDYGFRLYDPRNARWTTMDPLADSYVSTNPYVYCGGDPVNRIDPEGLEFTPASWEYVDRLLNYINRRNERNSKLIEEKAAELAEANSTEGKSKRLQRQIARLENANKQGEIIKAEILALQTSSQIYNVTNNNTLSTSDMLIAGTKYNVDTDYFEIMIPTGGDMALLAHELKHAYQFEVGELSSGHRTDGVPFYDHSDEVAAYERGSFFGGASRSLSSIAVDPLYKELKSISVEALTMHEVTLNSPVALQRIADNTFSAFRVNGVTYVGKTLKTLK